VDTIIDRSGNRWLEQRRDDVIGVAMGALSSVDMFILKRCVDVVNYLDEAIGSRVDERVRGLIDEGDLRLIATIRM
jgi:hypothetical protein